MTEPEIIHTTCYLETLDLTNVFSITDIATLDFQITDALFKLIETWQHSEITLPAEKQQLRQLTWEILTHYESVIMQLTAAQLEADPTSALLHYVEAEVRTQLLITTATETTKESTPPLKRPSV